MTKKLLTKVKRGAYEGAVYQEENRYTAEVSLNGKVINSAGPWFDQDEAEVELGTLIDNTWRENTAGHNKKLVRRM